jgi:putative ABC transport system substrate-binding protein
MAHAVSLENSFRRAGVSVGRILSGAKATELPILQPAKFESVSEISEGARVTVPAMLLATADEVIE